MLGVMQITIEQQFTRLRIIIIKNKDDKNNIQV